MAAPVAAAAVAAKAAKAAKTAVGVARAARAFAAESSSQKTESSNGGIVVKLLLGAFGVLIALASLGSVALAQQPNLPAEVERWRGTVVQACKDCDVDTEWTSLILAMMAQESGGNLDVSSVTGTKQDIMQASEGAHGWIIKKGWSKYNLNANTPEASIYAGVLEFKDNLELWEGWLGEIEPTNLDQVKLIVQGYNYGSHGWFAWCKKNNITEWSLDKSQLYSDTKMPAGAKGTPNHADLVVSKYYSSGNYFGSTYVAVAVQIANDDTVGYSQETRSLNPNVDCSSLVWFALKNSGFSTVAIGNYPFSTYTMPAKLKAAGFTEFSYESVKNNLQTGDILIRPGHTEIVYDPSNWSTVGAHSNYDGRDGDSSGEEVDISEGNAKGNWTTVYRKCW